MVSVFSLGVMGDPFCSPTELKIVVANQIKMRTKMRNIPPMVRRILSSSLSSTFGVFFEVLRCIIESLFFSSAFCFIFSFLVLGFIFYCPLLLFFGKSLEALLRPEGQINLLRVRDFIQNEKTFIESGYRLFCF